MSAAHARAQRALCSILECHRLLIQQRFMCSSSATHSRAHCCSSLHIEMSVRTAKRQQWLSKAWEFRHTAALVLAAILGGLAGSYFERMTSSKGFDVIATATSGSQQSGASRVAHQLLGVPPAGTCPPQAQAAPDSCPLCPPQPQCPAPTAAECAASSSSSLGAPQTLGLADFFRHDVSLRPVAPASASSSVCMLVRTFRDHRNKLMTLLASVLLWDHPSLTVFLIDTGKTDLFDDLGQVANMSSMMAQRPGAVRVSRWRNAAARASFPQLGDIEDHGYVATDLAIEDVLEMRKVAAAAGVPPNELPCDSLIVTNGDNLYGFQYLAATLEAMRGGASMVSTHWVSHYDMKKEWILGWGEIQNGHCGPWRPGQDGEVAASPKFIRGCVDLGVVTFKAKLLEEFGYRFVVDRLRKESNPEALKHAFSAMEALFYADGNFFSKIFTTLRDAGRESEAVMIRRALFVHQ